jgi:hypothetical protein
MKTVSLNRIWAKAFGILGAGCLLATASADAAVIWNLNPNNLQGGIGSNSYTFTQDGAQITARGYTRVNGVYQGAELFFKNRPPDGGAMEVGLGLANSPHNEINAGNPTPNYIQFDLRSILSQGFTNGMIAVSSLQNGESFQLFGSNAVGVLGNAITGPFAGLAFDNQFVAIPSFGTFQFISVIAASGNVLPSQFMATPIPEIATLMPILGLLVAVGATSFLRRRRAAQLTASA